MRGVSPSQTLPIAGGKPPTPPYLNLHDAAGPARRRDDHDKTTTRRTASQPPPYPCRRLHGSSLARSGAAIPSNSKNAMPCYQHDSRTTSCSHAKTPDKPTPALVSVSVPTPYDTGAGATEPIIPPMFVYVQGRSRRSGCDQTECAANNDEPAQGTPTRQAPTEDAETGIILM